MSVMSGRIPALQAGFEGSMWENKGGPERGVCTSGRGLTTHLELAERGSAHYA